MEVGQSFEGISAARRLGKGPSKVVTDALKGSCVCGGSLGFESGSTGKNKKRESEFPEQKFSNKRRLIRREREREIVCVCMWSRGRGSTKLCR